MKCKHGALQKLELSGPGKTYRPFRTNTQKRCPFDCRGLGWKSRKSRNTCSNRHIWPWNTEWSRAKANRVLPRERTGHSKHPLPTTQEKTLHMDITRWLTPKSDRLYSFFFLCMSLVFTFIFLEYVIIKYSIKIYVWCKSELLGLLYIPKTWKKYCINQLCTD